MSALDLVRAGEKAATIKAQQSAIASREAILRQEEAQYELYRQLYEKRFIADKDFDEALTSQAIEYHGDIENALETLFEYPSKSHFWTDAWYYGRCAGWRTPSCCSYLQGCF